jgi:thiol-disulfide isomerase/thioredoxin
MKRLAAFVLAILVAGLLQSGLWAEEKPPAAAPPSTERTPLVSETHPGLASGCLAYARLTVLPQGTLLKAGDLILTEKDVADETAKAPAAVQAQLKKNGFFMLEQVAGPKLIVQIAKAEAAKTGEKIPFTLEREIVEYHLGQAIGNIKVADAEVQDFYNSNKDTFGGATLEKVWSQVKHFILQEKEQKARAEYIKTLGRRTPIEVSAAWAKDQAAVAKDNVVDKARASGKPTMIDFGAAGCIPCEMMVPILADLKKKYEGKANVEFVHVGEEQVLAARYGVQAIPVQVFFDKDGKEVSRHVGFFPQVEIEKRLAEAGVK